METAAAKIARLDRSIARTGETVTLQRTASDSGTGAVTATTELTLPAHVRATQPQDLIAPGVRESRVILSATQLLAETIGSPPVAFGVPIKDDRILIQGDTSNVETIETFYYGGALVRVTLLCRG